LDELPLAILHVIQVIFYGVYHFYLSLEKYSFLYDFTQNSDFYWATLKQKTNKTATFVIDNE
jgi:hypothetical protein